MLLRCFCLCILHLKYLSYKNKTVPITSITILLIPSGQFSAEGYTISCGLNDDISSGILFSIKVDTSSTSLNTEPSIGGFSLEIDSGKIKLIICCPKNRHKNLIKNHSKNNGSNLDSHVSRY